MRFPKPFLEAIGYDPVADLNLSAIYARGGTQYGDYILLRCPDCGRPVLHDYEHDYFHSDPNTMERADLCSQGDTVPCPGCGFAFTADDIWDCANEPFSMRRFFLTLPEIQQHPLSWLLSPVLPQQHK